MQSDIQWFTDARYGLFIHYGLYSMLGRGEWVLNRERIETDEYRKLAEAFTADKLDFDDILRRAKHDWHMGYAVLTCKHHDGFCLYDSSLTDFTTTRTRCGRDLVAEFVAACRKHGLRIGLYHSLNDWTASPDAVDALERPQECYQPFIDFVHGQIRDIMSHYGKIDVMWYDGWWPFDGQGWQAAKLNAMVRGLQDGILVNGRCGLAGDFDTPENHIAPGPPGRPWEACVTLNENWGHHKGDHNWKTPKDLAEMLRSCAAGCGNLLLNVGPDGRGEIPPPAIDCLDRTGQWLERNGEAIFHTDRFVFSAHRRGDDLADWTPSGRFTAARDAFYWHIRHWPGNPLVLAGVESTVTEVTQLDTGKVYPFSQEDGRVIVGGVPQDMDTSSAPVVFRFRTRGKPALYLCGGHRTPSVEHCRYDPLPSDMPAML